MVNKILFTLISVSIFVVGIAFLQGGYYSSKHGLYFDFGDYNSPVWIGMIIFSLAIFILCVVRRESYRNR